MNDATASTKEKSVAGRYHPLSGIAFAPCQACPEIAQYWLPMTTDVEAHWFQTVWEENYLDYLYLLSQSNTDVTNCVDHKDLALIMAFGMAEYIQAKSPRQPTDFVVATCGMSLMTRIGDAVRCFEIRDSEIFRSIIHPDDPCSPDFPSDLDLARKPTSPRHFGDDFTNKGRQLVEMFNQIRTDPWPQPHEEHLVTGYYRSHTRSLHVRPTRELKKDIKKNFPELDFEFLKPGGCPISMFENSDMGDKACNSALCQPEPLFKNLGPLRLAVYGVEQVARYMIKRDVQEEFSFSVQTWGRAIRIGLEGRVMLDFIFKDSKTGNQTKASYLIPAQDIDFEGSLPKGWPVFHD